MKYEFDNLDRRILSALRSDCRRSYLEIARELDVSGGTIHQRMNKMRDAGVVTGFRLEIDYRKLGYGVSALVGIRLQRAGASGDIQEHLKNIPQIVEIHYTTGTYSLLARVVARDMQDLYELLSGRLQSFADIQSTETFVILDTPLDREPGFDLRPD